MFWTALYITNTFSATSIFSYGRVIPFIECILYINEE